MKTCTECGYINLNISHSTYAELLKVLGKNMSRIRAIIQMFQMSRRNLAGPISAIATTSALLKCRTRHDICQFSMSNYGRGLLCCLESLMASNS